MHRGPVALVPPLPFAAAIDASLWRRTAGWVRPRFLTQEVHRLRGMWRRQEEQNRQNVSSWMGFARMWRSLIREGRLYLARKPLQLRGAAEQCQDDVLDTGGWQLGE